MSISQNDIKKLFSLSAGMCNICRLQLAEHDVLIGEMAHIIAKSPNGPRGNNYSPQINSYNNLILLCPNHHTIVDTNPDKYPIDELIKIKNSHEQFIFSRLNVNKEYKTDLESLNTLFHYIPIKDFRSMAMELPNRVSINFNARDMFEEFCKANPDRYPFGDKELTILWEEFIQRIDNIDKWLLGTLTIKENKLITFQEMLNYDNNNQPGYNIYVHTYDDFIAINKSNLSYEQINLVIQNMQVLVQDFIYSHTKLIDYIRFNFREIKW